MTNGRISKGNVVSFTKLEGYEVGGFANVGGS